MEPASPKPPLPYPDLLIASMECAAEEAIREGRPQTDTIFRRVEALLSLGTFQNALGFVADRAIMARYRTAIDFLFCELFPEYAEACLAYYNEDAPQVKEGISTEEARRCEHAMICALAVAVLVREDQLDPDAPPRVRWSTVVATAHELAAQAPPVAAAVMQ